MTIGINYPWTVFRGRSNYGCDFGMNVWGSHAGVSAHTGDIRRDFERMAAAGVQVVRWFVFTDGRGGVRWDAGQWPAGLADGFVDDMDAALECARDAGLALCLVLFDYLWMIRRDIRDESGATVFVTRPELLAREAAPVLDALVDPVLDRYGVTGSRADLGAAIHSIDVINEPDWVTRGLALRSFAAAETAAGGRSFSRAELRLLIRGVADRVHRRTRWLVTVGGGRVRHAAEWDRSAYGLDFVQVHSYPDPTDQRRDRPLLGQSSGALGLTKPLLIGEFPASRLIEFLDLARDGGYLGAWPWSFNGIDDVGAVDLEAMRSWLRSL